MAQNFTNKCPIVDRIYAEIIQDSSLSHGILHKILMSRRLLIDHVECLEICLNDLQPYPKETSIFTLPKIVTLASATLICNAYKTAVSSLMRSFVMTATGTFGFFYVIKQGIKLRNKLIETTLENFIKALNSYSNCIKRNIVYFAEIQVMKSFAERDLELKKKSKKIHNCIKSLKDVAELIYDTTRFLEEKFELSMDIANLYCPMEELRDTDYFKRDVRSFSYKQIKEFHNIFLYVQSQFLFRLALLAAQNHPLLFIRQKIDRITNFIRNQIEDDDKYYKNMYCEMKKHYPVDLNSISTKIRYNKSPNSPIHTLKESSLKLSSCIFVVAEECQSLYETLQKFSEESSDNADQEEQDKKNLLEIANSMKSIENSLCICCDDFHRLILIYNKFLGSRINDSFEEGVLNSQNHDLESENNTNEISFDEKESQDSEKDDFFAFVNDETKGLVTEPYETSEQLHTFEEKLTKKRFKPVLKQLRDKIDPIRQEMLAKERKVLESKGIDIDKLFPQNMNTQEEQNEISSSEDESNNVDHKRKKKAQSVKDNYSEMRNFLAQKEALNILKSAPPPPSQNNLTEDVLE